MTENRQNSTASLRDLFRQEMEDSGGNPSMAFITILNELDQRMTEGSDRITKNARLVSQLIGWFKETDRSLKELPAELDSKVSAGLRRLVPEMTRQMEGKATTGARNGAMASQNAIQSLKAATERYEVRKRRLVTLAAFGLPSAFAVAILIGFLFSSFIIPALPNTWEWPCRLIGAEYRTAIDQNSTTTFCVIQRE